MHLEISGQHLEVTEPLKQYITDKLARVQRHIDTIIKIHVILSIDHGEHIVKAVVSLAGGQLNAHSESKDMYAAIDTLMDKLDQQAIKHKEKHKNHHGDTDE